MDLTEAEDIKKRWQEYTEELYRKDLHDPDNHDGVIIDLEPNILECEVKWALESITTNKASGGDGIPVELHQISPPLQFFFFSWGEIQLKFSALGPPRICFWSWHIYKEFYKILSDLQRERWV